MQRSLAQAPTAVSSVCTTVLPVADWFHSHLKTLAMPPLNVLQVLCDATNPGNTTRFDKVNSTVRLVCIKPCTPI